MSQRHVLIVSQERNMYELSGKGTEINIKQRYMWTKTRAHNV